MSSPYNWWRDKWEKFPCLCISKMCWAHWGKCYGVRKERSKLSPATNQCITLTVFYDLLPINFLICKMKWRVMMNVLESCPIPTVYDADCKWKKSTRQALSLGWGKCGFRGDSGAEISNSNILEGSGRYLNNKMGRKFRFLCGFMWFLNVDN